MLRIIRKSKLDWLYDAHARAVEAEKRSDIDRRECAWLRQEWDFQKQLSSDYCADLDAAIKRAVEAEKNCIALREGMERAVEERDAARRDAAKDASLAGVRLRRLQRIGKVARGLE